jgi:hypothetical protein
MQLVGIPQLIHQEWQSQILSFAPFILCVYLRKTFINVHAWMIARGTWAYTAREAVATRCAIAYFAEIALMIL